MDAGGSPDDPDPQYWGNSIGWYENGDTLVVDSIGYNDRSWLDQSGPSRTRRSCTPSNATSASAPTCSSTTSRSTIRARTRRRGRPPQLHQVHHRFMRYQWVCSVRDNNAHYQNTTAPGNASGQTTFGK
jgi:hypothetical protein